MEDHLLHIRFPAEIGNLRKSMHEASACAREAGLPEEKIGAVELALEEAIVNICSYAYPEGRGDIDLLCTVRERDLVFVLTDSGIPFNVTGQKEPDIAETIESGAIGGLGIFLMKQVIDDVRYRREKGHNVLELHVHLP